MYIALSKAVALAHRKLFPDEPCRDPGTLQVIALALSALMPIQRKDSLRELTDPELLGEGFKATNMEELVVSERRFEAALEVLQIGSLDTARATLTLRQSPRVNKLR